MFALDGTILLVEHIYYESGLEDRRGATSR